MIESPLFRNDPGALFRAQMELLNLLDTRTDTNVTDAWVSVHISALEDTKYWVEAVVNRKVARQCLTASLFKDDLLLAFRWLSLRLEAPTIIMTDVVQERLVREKNRKFELEIGYLPHVLSITRAAAAGQEGLTYALEDVTERKPRGDQQHAVREDIRCLVQGQRLHPSESNTRVVPASSMLDAIDANAEPFGHLLKVIETHSMQTVQPVQMCLFFANIWAVHRFVATYENRELSRIDISPPLPFEKHRYTPESRLLSFQRLRSAYTNRGTATLLDAMPLTHRGLSLLQALR